jgi:hypothetical protein
MTATHHRSLATGVFVIVLGLLPLTGTAADYYVDAEGGDDRNPGTAVGAAWKSLDQVNDADLKGGDRVLFKKGCAWRGSLRVKSGTAEAPVVYSSYGDSTVQPMLRQSVSLSDPKDWAPAGKNLWRTRPDAIDPASRTTSATLAAMRWGLHCDGDGKADLDTVPAADGGTHYRLTCLKAGRATSQIQFAISPFPVQARALITYTFRARASKPFSTRNIRLMQSRSPWTSYGSVVLKGPNDATLSFDTGWQDYHLELRPSRTADDGRIAFFLGTDIPEGCVFEFAPVSATSVRLVSLGLDADVGNLILSDAAGRPSAGWKRWSIAELRHPGDFYSDPSTPEPGPRTVTMYSERNPAEQHAAIEAALRHNIIEASGQSWFVVDGITCANTAAHGLAGSDVRNAVVRNCRFVWIGGGHLYSRPNPTRYGNGIEFWDACENNLVEGCLFAHVYDTAMTNQGPGPCTVRNMLWRNNQVEFCEQAYEIWFSHKDSVIEGLVYEGNKSYDCGFGWGHAQRPNKNGTHLLAYHLAGKRLDITYRDNLFCRTKDAFIWYFNDRLPNISACDGNVYQQGGGNLESRPLFRWKGQPEEGLTFEQYRKKTGFDRNSRLEPAPDQPALNP